MKSPFGKKREDIAASEQPIPLEREDRLILTVEMLYKGTIPKEDLVKLEKKYNVKEGMFVNIGITRE